MGIPSRVLVEMGVTTHDDRYIKYPVHTRDGKQVWRYRLVPGYEGARRFYWDQGVNANELLYIPKGFSKAVKANKGVAFISNGESSLWVYVAAGMRNVVSWFGETIIPQDIVGRLRKGGVSRLVLIPDVDAAGIKMAQNLLKYFRGKKIKLDILSWGNKDKGYDARDCWLDCRQDGTLFREYVHSLFPVVEKQAREYPPEVKEDIAYRLGVDISTANGAGWCKKIKCVFHDDRHPSAAYNLNSGVLHCFAGCGSKNIREVADHLGVELVRKPGKRVEKGVKDEGGEFADFERSQTTNKPLKNSLPNAIRALDMVEDKIGYRWDVMALRPQVDLRGRWEVANDHVIVSVKGVIWNNLQVELGTREIHEAVILRCKSNPYEPLTEHIDSLPSWDGVERDITDYLIFPEWDMDKMDNTLNSEVFRVLLRGMFARALNPGCKFDYCLVLVGVQGIGKSQFFEILASSDLYGSDTGMARADGRKPIEKAHGKWLLEDAEFVESGNVAQQARVKARLTSNSEQERLAYERYSENYPKRHVVVATTNQKRFLADTTGGRRYHIVHVDGFKLWEFMEVRDQILAEVYAKGEFREPDFLQLHGNLAERMRLRQIKAQLGNGIQDVVEDWFMEIGVPENQECWLKVKNMNTWLRAAVGYQQRSKFDYNQLRDTMARMGFRIDRKRVNNKQVRIWVRGFEGGNILDDDELEPPEVMSDGSFLTHPIPKHWRGDYSDLTAPPAKGGNNDN